MHDMFVSPEETLRQVHDFLKRPFWPEHLKVGEEYRLQADDKDENPDTRWLTIRIIDKDTVTISTERRVPDPNVRHEYTTKMLCATISQATHPLVHQAMLYMALAFRVDVYFFDPSKQRALVKARSRRLQRLYKLIKCLPWLTSLSGNDYYFLDDTGDQFGILYPPPNDSCIQIGASFLRIRDTSAGGGHYDYLRSVMKMTAEAIRLENE